MQRLAELILAYFPSIYPATMAILWDEKTTGTNGGTSTSATWNARDLTNEDDPQNIVALSSNKFVPIAGEYHIFFVTTFLGGTAATSFGKARLFNVTQSAEVARGVNTYGLTNDVALALTMCQFTANGVDEYRLETYTSVGRATNGLGAQVGDGGAEIYSMAFLEKIG